jgi:Yip1-like protein
MTSALNESFLDRLQGVVALNRPTYDALRVDPAATGQAWFIVVFLGLANGIALIVTPLVAAPPDTTGEVADALAQISAALTFDTSERQVMALVMGVIGAVISWYLSSWLLRAIGNRVAESGRTVNAEEMRRLVGWGYSPSLASFLSPIPLVGPLLAFLGTIWALVTGVMAVRAAFGIGIWKAIAIEIVAFLLVLLVVIILVILTVVLTLPFA